jgi:uncharacterized membrane protein YtjA (UPF0391 family)
MTVLNSISDRILEADMLGWALTFFIVAIIAAFFGFGGIATGAAGIAKAFFVLFLIVFLVSLVLGLARGRIHSRA